MNYLFDSASDGRKRGAHFIVKEISVRFDREDWASVLPTEVKMEGVEVEHVSLR